MKTAAKEPAMNDNTMNEAAMSDNKLTKLTPEQNAAVCHRGGALLVSAAAGSGKTKVLVERLFSRIRNGDDIDEFLVITYTRAAAAELRERISDEITEKLAESPGNRRLRRQSMLCRSAPIDTIHGFCTDILRENAHLAGFPPDFRIADESESTMIKTEVLEELLDGAYEKTGESAGFRELVDLVSPGRSDKRLSNIILDTYAKLQSCPDTAKWAAGQMEKLALTGITDVSETAWGAYLMEKARGTVSYWAGEMYRFREEARNYPEFDEKYGESIDATIDDIKDFLAALGAGWDAARARSAIDFGRVKVKRVTGYDDLKAVRLRCKAAMEKCALVFTNTSSECLEDMRAVGPAMGTLLRLITDFDKAFLDEKQRRGVVDFSDLEHLTLSLLTDRETGEKTGIAKAVSKRFKEIMVDEYQDVNAVQELIFNAVSTDGGNIFMVGDVKQSIYRFRLADPSIFLKKYEDFSDYPEQVGHYPDVPTGRAGTKILLSQNFRSKPGILETVNRVFSRIMSAGFGEMDYTRREYLIPGRDCGWDSGLDSGRDSERDSGRDSGLDSGRDSGLGSGRDCGPDDGAVEFNIIDIVKADEDDEGESPGKTQTEAWFVARRIDELVENKYMIPSGDGGMRPVRYSDVVILLRSVRGKAWRYEAALAEQGIPAILPGNESFFETLEIQNAISLLSIIDNPMQDIPLAATLRSSVYRFSADELAEIRAGSRGTAFYQAVKQAAYGGRPVQPSRTEPPGNAQKGMNHGILQQASQTGGKCRVFLEEIESMRAVMPDMPADRFIWHVYNKTGLPGLVGAMRGGQKRKNNLIALAEAARKYEQNGYKGLFGFLTFVKGLQERGADFPVDMNNSAGGEDDDAVRIMSIHKSKGLEFPVVILADTTKQFNYNDIQQPCLVHNEFGLGPKVIDMQRRIEYTTIARTAVQQKLAAEMRAEEMRVLYVAMTRAREKLIIFASVKGVGGILTKMESIASAQSSDDEKQSTDYEEKAVASACSATVNMAKIPAARLEEAKSTAEWILAAVINEAHYSKDGAMDGSVLCGDSRKPVMEIRVFSSTEITEEKETTGDETAAPNTIIKNASLKKPQTHRPCADPKDIELLRERFSFSYPYPMAPELPSKLTVTGLKNRSIATETDKEAALLYPESNAGAPERALIPDQDDRGALKKAPGKVINKRKPDFIGRSTGLTAADRGIALHLVMQHIDFNKCAEDKDKINVCRYPEVKDGIDRLVEKGTMSREQADAVDTEKIAVFIRSDIGKRIVNAENIRREFRFSLLSPAEDYYPGGGRDEILLQGVIDCFFEEDGEITVLDFKTDRVRLDELEGKIAYYTPQLAAYSNALERITGKRVKERLIYFFDLDMCVAIP